MDTTHVHRSRGLTVAAVLLVAVVAALALPALAAATNLTYAPAIIETSLGKNTTYVATGDLNKDGYPDIVAVNYTSANASVYLGTGTGTFTGPTLYAVGGNAKACVLKDMDGNGTLDLVVSEEFPNAVAVLKGDGRGGFVSATLYPSAHNEQLAVGDFNGDGQPDIVTVNDLIPGELAVMIATRQGGYQTRQAYTVGPSPRSVATGDFNRDGKLDALVAYEGNGVSGNVVQLFLGNGNGALNAAGTWPGGTTPKSVATGDFNKDGKLDFVVSSEGTNDVRLYLGNGSGGFTASSVIAVGALPKYVTTTDINNDGNLDAVAADYIGDDVAVMLGDGRGLLGAPTFMPVGNGPKCVAFADFNRDGKPDMVTADNDGSTVAFLYSTLVPPALTGVSASPSTFSPNADTYQDKTSITYTTNQSLYQTVAVYDSTGALVKTLKPTTVLAAGTQTLTWDGKYTPPGGATTYVADGRYDILITVKDGAGNTVQSSLPVIVDTTLAKIGVTYAYFSPNGDGRRDTTGIAYTLKAGANVTVLVRDGSGTTVRTIQSAVPELAGSYTATWDGLLDGGTVAPEGAYTAVVVATNAVGTVDNVKTTNVDLTPPVVSNAAAAPSPFVPPATTAITFDSTEAGTASVTIQDAARTTVRTLSQSVVAGANTMTWDGADALGAAVPAGTYTVKLSVNDLALNRATVYPVVLTVDVGQ